MNFIDAFSRLLAERPLVFLHALAALGALAIGALLLWRRKGTASHRALGWLWVLLMGTVTLSSAWIHDRGMPNLGGFSPIHALAAYVALVLPWAVVQARRGHIAAHRKAMRGLYVGGCVAAGMFALMPGRFLGQLVWPGVA